MNTNALVLAVGAAVVALASLACGSGNGEGGGATADGGAVASGVGPGISVEEALKSKAGGPLLVNGFLVRSGSGDVRLCTLLLTSLPPQCGGPSLIVQGLDLDAIAGLQRERDTVWSGTQVQVLGSLKANVLKASKLTKG